MQKKCYKDKTCFSLKQMHVLHLHQNLKKGTHVLIPNFIIQKGILKKLQPIQKDHFKVYKNLQTSHINLYITKKEIFQHRKNLFSYYPKEYDLCKLIQLDSFRKLHIVDKTTETNSQQKF